MGAIAKTILAVIAAFGCISVSGCTSSGSPTATNPDSQIATTELSYHEQLDLSYEKFTTGGGSEYVVSGGDNYILTYQPTSDGYSAALYNESFDDVIGIDEPLMVTLILAKTMLDDPATNVVETADGLELRNDQYGAIGLHFENGLVTSYQALEDTWHGNIEYVVDQKVVDMLAAKVAQEQG